MPPREGKSEIIRFDGKSLDGWEGNPEWWSVKDGAFVAKASGRVPTTFLLSAENYSDFRITLSSKVVESTNHAGVDLWGERNASPSNQWGYKGQLYS